MTIRIDPETELLVKSQMQAHGYTSPAELIAAALQQFSQDNLEMCPEDLNAILEVGVRELDAGEGVPAAKAILNVQSELQRRRQPKQP